MLHFVYTYNKDAVWFFGFFFWQGGNNSFCMFGWDLLFVPFNYSLSWHSRRLELLTAGLKEYFTG